MSAMVTQASKKQGLQIKLPTPLHMEPVPGMQGARMGITSVKVTDLPTTLDSYMEVNPRAPSLNTKGLLTGPVAAGILETLRDRPSEMVLKNQGLYLLVDKAVSAPGCCTLELGSVSKHGLVNGGHTYAAIREAINSASVEELKSLQQAYVPLHVLEGVPGQLVAEIAEGLNRSKQVDDPSLSNLQGEFNAIKRTLNNTPGGSSIAYYQGDAGSVYITEVLVIMELFNTHRFGEKKHPNGLYNRATMGLEFFRIDSVQDKPQIATLTALLPELLWLSDAIRAGTPEAAKKCGFKFGNVKVGTSRAGSADSKTRLPFMDTTMNYRIPNGWVYPMLASFRALLAPDMTWKVMPDDVLADILPDLVAVCISEHRDKAQRPELIGKRESAYAQCYREMQLYLAKKGKL